MDYISVIPYYRIVNKNGQEYFQELLVDKNGKYIINPNNPEKLASKMTFTEKLRLTAFQLTSKNKTLQNIRNTAISIAEEKLKQEEER